MTNSDKLADALRKIANYDPWGSDEDEWVTSLALVQKWANEALAEHDAQPAPGECEPLQDETQGLPPGWRNCAGKIATASPHPAPAPVQVDGWWRVEVSDSAGQIVAIEPGMLAGRDVGCGSDDATIRLVVEHLRSFIGEPAHPPAPAADGAGELPEALRQFDDIASILADSPFLGATGIKPTPEEQHDVMVEAGRMLRRLRPAIAALRQPVPDAGWRVPPLDDDSRWILGRPNFTLIGVAMTLRKLGYDIPKKAEEEQAACIHWMLGMLAKHGNRWRDEAERELATSLASQQESRNA